MTWLLDTHTLLWMAGDVKKLAPGFAKRLRANPPPLFFSAAGAWEIAIKHQLGKLKLKMPPAEFLATFVDGQAVEALPIDIDDALAAAALPPVHRDPFDRMLAAQALARGMTLVSADPIFARYGCAVLDPTR